MKINKGYLFYIGVVLISVAFIAPDTFAQTKTIIKPSLSQDKTTLTKPSATDLRPASVPAYIPPKTETPVSQEDSSSSESTSNKLIDLEQVNRTDRTEAVTEKLTNTGQEPRDLSKLNQMFEKTPDGSRFADPAGKSLLDDSGHIRPTKPGLFEERDFQSLSSPSEIQKARESLGESFGLTRSNPKNDLFNDQMGGISGSGDPRLLEGEGEEAEGQSPPPPDDGPTCGPQGDGTYNIATDKGEVVTVQPQRTTKTTAKSVIGNVWGGIVDAVGGTDGEDDSSTTNVAVGVRGTPEPDQAPTRFTLSEKEKAAILQEEGYRIGKGGDALEPGGRTYDPTAIKENASKLTENFDALAPYARPTPDDSGGGSEDFSGFGNEQLPGIEGTLVDPIEPELEGSADNPNQPGEMGGDIPRN